MPFRRRHVTSAKRNCRRKANIGTTIELSANELYRRIDPEQLNFCTTDDLADLSDMVGQPRAAAALQFGIGMAEDD